MNHQAQLFQQAGVPREEGVIETIINDYGFIKRRDHPDTIYFKLADIENGGDHSVADVNENEIEILFINNIFNYYMYIGIRGQLLCNY